MSNSNQPLYEALWNLDATGPDGFEGLIAQLLESLTGKHFFLAKAGFQGGRDMSTDHRNANAIECKRYQASTDLDDRQLLGEVQQASWSTPDLDLWVLVTTRTVSAQLITDLKRSVWEKGFEVAVIDTFERNGGPPSSLAALCAHNPDMTLHFLQKKHTKSKITDIRKILDIIRQHPRYQETLEGLRREFSTAMIGYDNWRQHQNSWLLEKFQSQPESRAAFNQVINVLDPSAWRIERERINAKLDNWLQNRWPTNQEFVALPGEEGDGKTWAVASWLARKLKTDPDFPAVLFLTSNALPATCEPQELLAHAIALQLREFDVHYWEKRVWNWMKRTPDELPQIVLVLDGINERHDVAYWRSVLEKSDWNDSERKAEDWLFPSILADLPAREQVEALLARPDEALDLVQYRYLFRPLAPRDAENLLQNPSNTTNPRRLQRILWFLFVNPIPLPSSINKQLTTFLASEDTVTRRFVLEFIHSSQDKEAIQLMIGSSWGWHPDHWFKEDQLGRLLLSNFGFSLSYQEIRTRVHPVYRGYAVEKRGLIEAEVRLYAEDIHAIWQHIKENGTASPENFPDTVVRYHDEQEAPLFDGIGISTDFLNVSLTAGPDYYSSWGGIPSSEKTNDGQTTFLPGNDDEILKQRTALLQETLQKQAKTGNDWFAKQFLPHSLKQVIAARSDLLQQWLQAVDEELLWLCGSFYETLLKVLFEEKPDEALKLWRKMDSSSGGIHFIDSNTGLRIMEKVLFECPAPAHVQPVWQEKLENCSNDLELFELALITQYTGNPPWMKAIIQEGVNSPWQFEQARAMLLFGFLEDSESETILQQNNDMPQCWTQKVAKHALQHCKRNLWAKQWFQKFLEDEDDVKAWACFKLFLKCVDRRFSLWEPKFVNEESLKNMRLKERVRFLRLNQNELQNHIKKNEKKRKETFLGEKVLKDKVWPWMNF